MSTKLQQLAEKRQALVARIKQWQDDLRDDSFEWDAEKRQNWDELNRDYDQTNSSIEALQRSESIIESMTQEQPSARPQTDEQRRAHDAMIQHELDRTPGEMGLVPHNRPELMDENRALKGCLKLRFGKDEPTQEEARAMRRYGYSGSTIPINLTPRYDEVRSAHRQKLMYEQRVAPMQLTDIGGVLPTDISRRVEIALLAFGGVRQVATVIRTETANTLKLPITDDTATVLPATPVAEGGTQTSDEELTITSIDLTGFKYSTNAVRVSYEAVRDSMIDLVGFIGDQLGTRMARMMNRDFTTGDGSSKPNGIVTAAADSTLGVDTTGATDMNHFIDLLHSVDVAYRSGGTVGFMFHDTIASAARQIVASGDGRYFWEMSAQVGQPDRLFGFPVFINNQMVSTEGGTDRYCIFGDFSKYVIRDIAGSARLRILNEVFWADDEIGIVFLQDADGDLLDAGTGPVKYMEGAV